jgi:hypothetical protein
MGRLDWFRTRRRSNFFMEIFLLRRDSKEIKIASRFLCCVFGFRRKRKTFQPVGEKKPLNVNRTETTGSLARLAN